jgi:hypothetical protein
MGIPIIVVDLALQITRASRAAASFFKIANAVTNPHISQIYTPEGFPNLPALTNQCLQANEQVTASFEQGTRNFMLACAPFSDSRKMIRGASIIITDLGESKQLKH